MNKFICRLIIAYRYLISPFLGDSCRFYPSCSHYAEQAIAKYGVIKGAKLAILRIAKCHPWHEGGIDPIPESHPPSTNN